MQVVGKNTVLEAVKLSQHNILKQS